jgi:hypothetical protein
MVVDEAAENVGEIRRTPAAAAGSLMRASSGEFEVLLEALPAVEHGPEDVDTSAREGEDGLMMAFSSRRLRS